MSASTTAKPVKIGPPYMWPDETAAFEALLAERPASYLEFGMGGSTLQAVRSGIAQVVAVDTDREWAAAVRSHAEIAPRIADGSVSILHADVGPVVAFGAPESDAAIRRWPSYIRLPWLEWDRRGSFPELVFVDGRFRVACCLSIVVAHALQGRSGPGPVIAMHDVGPQRKSYDQVLTFMDITSSVRSFQVMRLKPDASAMQALLMLLEAQFDGQ